MKKIYDVKKNFWIGEIGKELKLGAKVSYDADKCLLTLNEQTFKVVNLKAAIKAEWLVPEDGKFPELNGPVGETQTQEQERKRKERFAEMATKEKKNVVQKDAQIVGTVDEERDPEGFFNSLGLEKNPPKKGKYVLEVLEDDAKVVATIKNTKEQPKKTTGVVTEGTKEYKETLNIEEPNKKFKVHKDHYDAESEIVGKYVEENKDSTVTSWSTLHWKKKAVVIDGTKNKDLLNKLKTVEQSEKIIERINNRIESLQH